MEIIWKWEDPKFHLGKHLTDVVLRSSRFSWIVALRGMITDLANTDQRNQMLKDELVKENICNGRQETGSQNQFESH